LKRFYPTTSVSWIYPKMKLNKDMNYTPYKDVNEVLNSLTSEIAPILGENLVGVYLTGSLSYGDFNPENSSFNFSHIDFLTLLTTN
jgi:predicted nucleotidyltransferase